MYEGEFGDWADYVSYCPHHGYAIGFELRTEDCGCSDNTAVNSIKFTCSGGPEIQSHPGVWGDFNLPQSCPDGYSKAQARILPDTVSEV